MFCLTHVQLRPLQAGSMLFSPLRIAWHLEATSSTTSILACSSGKQHLGWRFGLGVAGSAVVQAGGVVHRCYEMERRLKTPDLFKFPYFEAICWYVAKNLLETLKGKSQTSET